MALKYQVLYKRKTEMLELKSRYKSHNNGSITLVGRNGNGKPLK